MNQHIRTEDMVASPPWRRNHVIEQYLSCLDFRVIRPIYVGQLVIVGYHVSDRVYPDSEQMLLDCALGNC